ncbi:hypothetical protein N7508_006010 [Penicillium antarcticum]|uniref:uncharacterized protein n=1 Tax=Penicillium antarcticum TaxID=416450 RepID=UPI00239392C8|nr:uncharacterized protein N7508_006010 [Penicillium antarcticum]KAJ5306995.1 hypothetical protein N7508_006010 [Penicillium antarcticum]
MEGYDTILMGNFLAYPEFQKKFGQNYGGDIGWQVSAPWQTGLSMASTVGCIFGGLLNGWCASRYGYRIVMVVALFFLTAFIFITVSANSTAVLLVRTGPLLIVLGCIRDHWTGLIASDVLYGLVGRTDQWSYRIPFALQWIWPVPLIAICWLASENPWWLVRQERFEEDAKRSIRRLGGSKTEDQINGQLAMMVHTIKIEAEIEAGTSYADCFKGVDLRRTEIYCLASVGQILSGSIFAYTPTYFFTQAGMDTSRSFQLGVGCTGGILCTILFLIGILNAASDTSGAMCAQAALCFLWLFTYSLTVGPITYAGVSEMSSVRLRPLTVYLARTAYQIIDVVSQVLEPYFMNPTAWKRIRQNWILLGRNSAMCIDRTYAELDILFATKVPARKFATTKVDAYAAGASSSQEGLVRAEWNEM